MAAGRPTNTPTFRRLHHPGILHMFHNSGGTLMARRTLVQTTCLFQTVWLPVRNRPPSIWSDPPCLSVCSHFGPSLELRCIFFCLVAPCSRAAHGTGLRRCVQCHFRNHYGVFVWGIWPVSAHHATGRNRHHVKQFIDPSFSEF